MLNICIFNEKQIIFQQKIFFIWYIILIALSNRDTKISEIIYNDIEIYSNIAHFPNLNQWDFTNKIYGSFHIGLTVDVADLNEIIFFGSLSTLNRHVYFCLAKKIFFTGIRFFEFSKKWYFRHSKRTFKPVYLENNCSHENFSKLRKLGYWLFFTEIVVKKLFKYFLTYKSKEINGKSFFFQIWPLSKFFFLRGSRFFEVCYKIWQLNKNGWIIDSEVMEFWRASGGLARNPGTSIRGERFTGRKLLALKVKLNVRHVWKRPDCARGRARLFKIP